MIIHMVCLSVLELLVFFFPPFNENCLFPKFTFSLVLLKSICIEHLHLMISYLSCWAVLSIAKEERAG